MSKLLCNVLKISEGANAPNAPPPLVARLICSLSNICLQSAQCRRHGGGLWWA